MNEDKDEDAPGPHPDHETPIVTPKGPMSLSDALKDPEVFVRGTSEEKTYAMFVEFGPMTLRTMLAEVDGASECKIEPYTHAGKSGCLLTTADEDLFVRLQDRFSKKDEIPF